MHRVEDEALLRVRDGVQRVRGQRVGRPHEAAERGENPVNLPFVATEVRKGSKAKTTQHVNAALRAGCDAAFPSAPDVYCQLPLS